MKVATLATLFLLMLVVTALGVVAGAGARSLVAVWCLTDTYCVQLGVTSVVNDSVVVGGHAYRFVSVSDGYYLLKTYEVRLPPGTTYVRIKNKELNLTLTVIPSPNETIHLLIGDYDAVILSNGVWCRFTFNVPATKDLVPITQRYAEAVTQGEWRVAVRGAEHFAFTNGFYVLAKGSKLFIINPFIGFNRTLTLGEEVEGMNVFNGSVLVRTSMTVFRVVFGGAFIRVVPVASAPYALGFTVVTSGGEIRSVPVSVVLSPAVESLRTLLESLGKKVVRVDVMVQNITWGHSLWTFTGYVAIPYTLMASFNVTMNNESVVGTLRIGGNETELIYVTKINGTPIRFYVRRPSMGQFLLLTPSGKMTVMRGMPIGVYPCGSDAYLIRVTTYGVNVTVIDPSLRVVSSYRVLGRSVLFSGGRLYAFYGSVVAVYDRRGLLMTWVIPEGIRRLFGSGHAVVVEGLSGKLYWNFTSQSYYVGADPLIQVGNDTIWYYIPCEGVVGYLHIPAYPVVIRWVGSTPFRFLIVGGGRLVASVLPRGAEVVAYVPSEDASYTLSALLEGGLSERRVRPGEVVTLDLRLIMVKVMLGWRLASKVVPVEGGEAIVCGYSTCRYVHLDGGVFTFKGYIGTYYVYYGGYVATFRVSPARPYTTVYIVPDWVRVRPRVVIAGNLVNVSAVGVVVGNDTVVIPVINGSALVPMILEARYVALTKLGSVLLEPRVWVGTITQRRGELTIRLVVPEGFSFSGGELLVCGIYSHVCVGRVVTQGGVVTLKIPLPDVLNITFTSVGFIGKARTVAKANQTITLPLTPRNVNVTIETKDYYTHKPIISQICLGNQCIQSSRGVFSVWGGGEYVVKIASKGYRRVNLTVVPRVSRYYLVTLKPVSINFTVVVKPPVPAEVYVYSGGEYVGMFSGSGHVLVSVPSIGKYTLIVRPKARGWASSRFTVDVVEGMKPVVVGLKRSLVRRGSGSGGGVGFSVQYVVVGLVAVVAVVLFIMRAKVLRFLRTILKTLGAVTRKGSKPRTRLTILLLPLLLLSLLSASTCYGDGHWSVRILSDNGEPLSGNYTVVYPDGEVVKGNFSGLIEVMSEFGYAWVTVWVPGYGSRTIYVSNDTVIHLTPLKSVISLMTLVRGVDTNRVRVGECVTGVVSIHGVRVGGVRYVVGNVSGVARRVGGGEWVFRFVVPNASVVAVTVFARVIGGGVLTASRILYVIRPEVVVREVGAPQALRQVYAVLLAVERELTELRGNYSLITNIKARTSLLEKRVNALMSKVGELTNVERQVSDLEKVVEEQGGELRSLKGSLVNVSVRVSRVEGEMNSVLRAEGMMRVMGLVASALSFLSLLLSVSVFALVRKYLGGGGK